VLYAVVTHAGALPAVKVLAAEGSTEQATTTETPEKTGPNPIAPELKEIAWGAGAFILLAVVMRYWLFPKLKNGMDARYASIRNAHETAEATRDAAQAEVAAYDAGIAEARAEAAVILDEARREVEADRQRKLAAANSRIAERRAAAAVEAEAAKAAAMGHIEDAVAEVAAAIAGRVLEQPVDPSSVRDTVRSVVSAGVAS
jgi:F-type H+-transporting ATPase subunit b